MKKYIKSALSKVKGAIKSDQSKKDLKYKIGNYVLNMPFDHGLPIYQSEFKLYDKKLGLIINLISNKNKNGCFVDIGANVGDTAALIRSNSELPILCIEGDEVYLKYLYENTKDFQNLDVCNCFVGEENTTKNIAVEHKSGTARLVENSTNSIVLKGFNTILSEKGINPSDILLLKIDTDGYDFPILLGMSTILGENKPNLFFEYDLSFSADSVPQAQLLISKLEQECYSLIVYDNFGNFITLIENELTTQINYLNIYLKSSQQFGGGIYYYDIFATTDKNLLKEVLNIEYSMLSNTKIK